MKLIFKPHPKTTDGAHTLIDIYSENDPVPWGHIHVDALYSREEPKLYDNLYKHGYEVTVNLIIEEIKKL